MAKYKRAEIRCLISADITASSLYFHERYQSELVMSYARIFRKEFCQWGDAAYFASVDNKSRELGKKDKIGQLLMAEEVIEYYKNRGIEINQ